MKKDIRKDVGDDHVQKENNTGSNSQLTRRKFVGMTAASAVGFTIVPRAVLGGVNFIPPSDKITLAYIGVGTQGIRELLPLLSSNLFHVVAVCDPNKQAIGYKDWGKDWLRNEIRKTINNPNWTQGGDNIIPG